MNDINLDEIISVILKGDNLAENTLVSLFLKLTEVLYLESNVLELQSPITICGDIHGQLYDLFMLFRAATQPPSVSNDSDINNLNDSKYNSNSNSDNIDSIHNFNESLNFGNQKFLFMGDYVDRGRFSLNTFAFLCALKLKYPGQLYLLRGNHECRNINKTYGFYCEVLFNYGHLGIWNVCNNLFDLLPMAALIDNRVFSVHGGLSPKVHLIESISLHNRQRDLPLTGALSDLCWSDPDELIKEWRGNIRGAGFLFGEQQVKSFCHNNKLDFITRSHQIAMDGYQWFFNRKLITIWSAPNYMYRSGNRATIMKYDPKTEKSLFYSNNDNYNSSDNISGDNYAEVGKSGSFRKNFDTFKNDISNLVFFEPCPEEERKIPAEIPTSAYFL